MSSEKTTNLQLNKWVPTDYVKMDEFNENFDKIDEVAADHAAQLADNTNKIGILYKRADWVSVKEFGAKGDGVTDDTAAIQSAIDYCTTINAVLVFPPGVYCVSTLLPKDGVKGYLSIGATLKAIAKAGEGVFASSLSSTANNYFIDGFTIDCNGLARRGIFINGNYVRVSNNRIYGLNNPSNSEQGIRLYKNSCYNIIENNKITLGMDVPFGTFPSLVGISLVGNPSSIYAGLDTSNDVVEGTEHCNNNIIKNNVVEGGTHGISLNTAQYNVITGNWLKNQTHRNIILSPLASCNNVIGNECAEFGSAGVHIAYGSHNNLVSGNNIYSSGSLMISDSGGEGAIQVYVYSKNNTIAGNNIYTKSTRYGIYSAIHCNGLVVQDNVVEGGLRASIAIESDWSSSPTAPEKYARPNYSSPPNPNWTTWDNGKKFEYITVKNNVIQKLTMGSLNCGIYIGQSQNAALNNLVLDGNVINSLDNSAEDLYVYVNNESLFNDCVIKNNTVTPVEVLQIILTNKNLKLIDYSKNNWQDRTITINNPTNILDFSVSNNISLTTSCTIDSATGFMVESYNFPSRIVTVRLYSGVTIVHDNAKIRLKNDTNVSATSSKQIITFICMSGTLFELSRNF